MVKYELKRNWKNIANVSSAYGFLFFILEFKNIVEQSIEKNPDRSFLLDITNANVNFQLFL